MPDALKAPICKAGRTEMSDKTTVGIDVSKAALDVYIDTSERLIHLENSASGIMQLLKELDPLD